MLIVTCIKIHSIILSFTCHGFKKLSPTHTHPLKTICEFSKPYKLLIFELELLIKCWIWIGKKISLNNFIFHLSWFEKLSPTHTHPLKTICEFSKPYELLVFEFRVTHKMLNVNWDKISLNNFIFHLSWFEKLSPTHTHPLKTICEFSKPYELLFFWVRVTHKMLIVTWHKNSLNNFIFHLSWL